MLNKKIKKFLNKKILFNSVVYGDIMFDFYNEVKIKKISAEAPVLVVSPVEGKNFFFLGGAGNVFNNLANSGVSTSLVSIRGEEEINFFLKKIKFNEKIFLIQDNSFINIKKKRIISNNKHLLRIDEEKDYFPKNNICDLVLKKVSSLLKKHNYLIVSDYNKGIVFCDFVKKILEMNKTKKIKIIVDSKDQDLSKFANVYLIKFNLEESKKAFGVNDIQIKSSEKKIFNFLVKFNINYCIITTGEDGAFLYSKQKKRKTFRTVKKKEVYDVSGAGDTFLAYLASALIKNMTVEESIEIANYASGIAVSRFGTSTVSKKDLCAE